MYVDGDFVLLNENYMEKLKSFVKHSNFVLRKNRIDMINTLYSKNINELKPPNIKFLSNDEWNTIIVVISNYLFSNNIRDFRRFYEYFNYLSDEDKYEY
jgi:hypothetical protein